jgi:hypothetical protein
MVSPLPPPDDGNVVTIWHYVAGITGGAVGAVITAAGFIWRAAALATKARAELVQHRKDIDVLEGEIKALVAKNDTRHEDAQRAINRLANTVAAQPDKQDFQRLEDRLEKAVDDIKRMVSAAAR